MDDDIVHALKKFKDKCNQLVVGSSPTRGADIYRDIKDPIGQKNIFDLPKAFYFLEILCLIY